MEDNGINEERDIDPDSLHVVEIGDGEFHDNDENEYLYSTPEEMNTILSQRQGVVIKENMDPFEWSVRKVIPIPSVYYWDVVQDEKEYVNIPWRIRAWHSSISRCCSVGEWMDRKLAQPIARSVGLTDSRFDFVTDHMSSDDWKASRHEIQRRKNVGKQASTPKTEIEEEIDRY